MNRFSICTSVYKNDKPEYVRVALDSMLVNQSVKPLEIVLVQDGPVPDETNRVITAEEAATPGLYKVVRLEQNQGLGIALQKGRGAPQGLCCTGHEGNRHVTGRVAEKDRSSRRSGLLPSS